MQKITDNTAISAKKMNRREILTYGAYSALAGGLSSGLCLSGCANRRRKKTKPNVVLIVLDTARADRFSYLGSQRATTPYIDTVASAAAVYEKAYATTFWTLPTHASIFTGLYPSQAGATSETLHLPDSNVTITEMLRQSGYATAAFSCNVWVSKERGFAKGFDEFAEMWRQANQTVKAGGPDMTELITTDKITSWLTTTGKKEPFFLFVNLNSAHLPYEPPKPFLDRFLRHDYDKRNIARISRIHGIWAHLTGKIKLTKNDLDIMNALYDAEIAVADYCVEQIIETLKKLDALDNTLVIITSDHGENLGEHGMIDHLFSMYDTIIHIPLIIRYPARFPAGMRNDDLISQIDIAPTILDVCNIQNRSNLLLPDRMSLASKDREIRKYVFAENDRPISGIELVKRMDPHFDVSGIDCRMRMLRTRRDKMIWSIGVNEELYNMDSDPDELVNIADNDPARSNKLQNILKVWMQEIGQLGETPSFISQDKESMEKLRSLGYIE